MPGDKGHQRHAPPCAGAFSVAALTGRFLEFSATDKDGTCIDRGRVNRRGTRARAVGQHAPQESPATSDMAMEEEEEEEEEAWREGSWGRLLARRGGGWRIG